jgi:predicted kinase
VVLVLVGAVGSGKSTFACSLLSNSQSSWARVNQDSLKTRKRCEAVARQSLAGSTSVIVDRMSFDSQQRAHWVEIAARFQAPCYALHLKYPAHVCADRAGQRLNHEGGVTGGKARQLAHAMSKTIAGAGVAMHVTLAALTQGIFI